jgi:DNA-binding NarL/FixJ family response regulator
LTTIHPERQSPRSFSKKIDETLRKSVPSALHLDTQSSPPIWAVPLRVRVRTNVPRRNKEAALKPNTLIQRYILNVSYDQSLLYTRELLLRSVGYVVESTSSIEDALVRFRARYFHAVLIGYTVSERDRKHFISLIRQHKHNPSVPVVFVSNNDEPIDDPSADIATANDPERLLQSVRVAFLEKGIAELSGGSLTPRQREVLQLVAEGKASKEIATLLNVSLKTVEFHRGNLMDVLGLRSIAELTRFALLHRIIS